MSSEKAQAGQLPHEQPTMDNYPLPPPGPPPSHGAGGANEEHFPPPPPGPPPGHNGLALNPHANQNAVPQHDGPQQDAHQPTYAPPPASEELYEEDPPAKQTAHQPPPPEPTSAEAAAAAGASKKPGWGQRFSTFGSKAAAPFNMLANKIGAEAFLPTTMDKECEKAARILKSFCKDGIYTETNETPVTTETQTGPDGKPKTQPQPKKNRTLLTIPSKVINKAVGLAIFTTARAGFHISGSSGSGIVIARLPDGSWSPPSGIQVHSVGAGFVIGIDIYDCVVVINTKEALEAFTKTRMSLGSDLAVVAGPWGAGGSVDFAAPSSDKGKGKAAAGTETTVPGETTTKEGDTVTGSHATEPILNDHVHEKGTEPATGDKEDEEDKPPLPARPEAGKERKPSALKQVIKTPTYSYVKSRGFYAGVQVDGTVVTERKDANAAFYGEKVDVHSILKGEVPLVPSAANWPMVVNPLFDVIKGAEGWHAQQTQTQQGVSGTGAVPSANTSPATGAAAPFPTATAPESHARPTAPTRTLSVAERVQQLNMTGSRASPPPSNAANAKAAEAAAESAANRQQEHPQSMVPPYTERASAEEQPPPAYEVGPAKPATGDTNKSGTYQ